MNRSQNLKDELLTLPATIQNILGKTIPTMTIPASSYNSDEPTRNTEILAYNLCLVLHELEGFSIAAAMMHIGQLNSVNQVMALASLRMRKDLPGLDVIAPPDGETFGLESELMCEIELTGNVTNVESVTYTRTNPDASEDSGDMLTGAEAVELEVLDAELIKENHYYLPQILYDAGDYVFTFAAVVNGTSLESEKITVTAS